jgi:hypothetical protein
MRLTDSLEPLTTVGNSTKLYHIGYKKSVYANNIPQRV